MPHVRATQVLTILLAVCSVNLSTAAPPESCPQAGFVIAEQKISQLEGGLGDVLDEGDKFGASVAGVGDVDGDGVPDMAVGAIRDDDGPGASNRGAVWILFLNPNGTVKGVQKISETAGGFSSQFETEAGRGLGALGTLNGDSVPDLAVGEIGADGGRGAVWIMFLDTAGMVTSHQKISDTEGSFSGTLDPGDNFGRCAGLGDLDGDGVRDLAVGAPGDNDGGPSRGAVWILFLNADGTVKAHQKISATSGDFTGALADDDGFGTATGLMSDLDGDGVRELAVGAIGDDDGGTDRGAVWVLFMNCNGTVKAHQKISSTAGGFAGPLENADQIGRTVSEVGDLDGDGVPELAVGTVDDDGNGANGSREGAVWVLFLNADGTVNASRKITEGESGFVGPLDFFERFGWVDALGDLDGDGKPELGIGARCDDDGDVDAGAVYVVSLDLCGPPPTITQQPECSLLDPCNTPSSVTFAVAAEAEGPLSYQWRRDGQDIAGATMETLTILDPERGDTGLYDCVVSTSGSLDSVTSAAVLAFRPSPCNGDLDDDCDTDIFDFGLFAPSFGCNSP